MWRAFYLFWVGDLNSSLKNLNNAEKLVVDTEPVEEKLMYQLLQGEILLAKRNFNGS